MSDDIQSHTYKSAIEALLFVSDKPIAMDQFKSVFPELKPSEVTDLIRQVQDEYVARNAGMVVVEIAGGWQMLSNSHAAPYIREFYKTKTKEKLSKPALECLAIIAYKQPVGRAEVEVIRGVNSDGTIAHLLNKGLIEIVGRKEVPGRPFLYGTTKAFLEYFGLSALEGLPKIEQLASMNLEAVETIQAEYGNQGESADAIDAQAAASMESRQQGIVDTEEAVPAQDEHGAENAPRTTDEVTAA